MVTILTKACDAAMEAWSPDDTKGKFPESPRFFRDGTTKISNFINGRDGEGRELSPVRVSVDTNTHTAYTDRLCGTSEATVTILDEIHRSLMGRSGINTNRPRTATFRALQANDPRHDRMKPPYPEENLGPGTYDVEVCMPGLGPLRPDSPLRTANPLRDPMRSNASFTGPVRPELFKASAAAAHLTSYLSADYKGFGERTCEWFKSTDKRTPVSDYRYSARYSELKKEVPSPPIDYDIGIGSSGMPKTVSCSIARKPATVPFMSKKPRFAVLPKERHNDVRLGTQRSDEDPGRNGPGSYQPITPTGAAPKPTFRIFTDGPKSPPRFRPGPRALTPLYGSPSKVISATASFSGTNRVQKFGPFDMMSDSTLTKRPL